MDTAGGRTGSRGASITSSDRPPRQHSGRAESCSPTSALPYCLPSPSPLPFNPLSSGASLSDMGLSLQAADPKSIHYSSSQSSYDDLRGQPGLVNTSQLGHCVRQTTLQDHHTLGGASLQPTEIIGSLPKLPLIEVSADLPTSCPQGGDAHLDLSLASPILSLNAPLRQRKLTPLDNVKLTPLDNVKLVQQDMVDVRLLQQEVPTSVRLVPLSVAGPVQLMGSSTADTLASK